MNAQDRLDSIRPGIGVELANNGDNVLQLAGDIIINAGYDLSKQEKTLIEVIRLLEDSENFLQHTIREGIKQLQAE